MTKEQVHSRPSLHVLQQNQYRIGEGKENTALSEDPKVAEIRRDAPPQWSPPARLGRPMAAAGLRVLSGPSWHPTALAVPGALPASESPAPTAGTWQAFLATANAFSSIPLVPEEQDQFYLHLVPRLVTEQPPDMWITLLFATQYRKALFPSGMTGFQYTDDNRPTGSK